VTTYQEAVITAPTLPFAGIRAFSQELVLVAAAIGLPVVSHILHAPVRYLLPMHWAIILAGMVYGWRAGALAGLLVPSLSYLLSGMPFPVVLPSMTAELLTYGFVTGMIREKTGLSAFVSVAIALVAGRLIFVLVALVTNPLVADFAGYLRAAFTPGLGAAICQVIFLPYAARSWVRSEHRRRYTEHAY